MDHLRYQSSQTAASYVAAQLDPQEQEAFELHMMSCPECVGEVESWRVIQQGLPGARPRELEIAAAAASRADIPSVASQVAEPKAALETNAKLASPPRWRVAVAVTAVALAGAAGGWFARTLQEPGLGSDDMAFFALNGATRGGEECQALRLDAGTRIVALRVPGSSPDLELAAVDANGRDLAHSRFSARPDASGGWVARLRADALGQPGVRLETRSTDGTVEPLGCVVSAPRR
jgi:hypothetical protein